MEEVTTESRVQFVELYKCTMYLYSAVYDLDDLGGWVKRSYIYCAAQSKQSATGLFSSRLNWDPPAGECVLPPLVPVGGRTHSLGGEGVRGLPNSDEGTDTVCTLGIYVLCAVHIFRRCTYI
jgi:hypothetical protein